MAIPQGGGREGGKQRTGKDGRGKGHFTEMGVRVLIKYLRGSGD
jgi:hypothetical protein